MLDSVPQYSPSDGLGRTVDVRTLKCDRPLVEAKSGVMKALFGPTPFHQTKIWSPYRLNEGIVRPTACGLHKALQYARLILPPVCKKCLQSLSIKVFNVARCCGIVVAVVIGIGITPIIVVVVTLTAITAGINSTATAALPTTKAGGTVRRGDEVGNHVVISQHSPRCGLLEEELFDLFDGYVLLPLAQDCHRLAILSTTPTGEVPMQWLSVLKDDCVGYSKRWLWWRCSVGGKGGGVGVG